MSNWMIKVGRKHNPEYIKKRLNQIQTNRIKNNKDKRPQPISRILLAAMRDDVTVQRLSEADFIDEARERGNGFGKRGQVAPHSVVLSPFRFIIVIFIAVLLIAGLIYVTGLLNDVFMEAGLTNEVNAGRPGYVNLTQAAQNTFGKVNEATQGLRLVAIALIVSEIIILLVFNAFVKVHPVLFIVWIFIVFLAVIFSVPVSNAYETILQSGIYEGGLESFTAANWILLNLPITVLILGVLGGVFMFINILRGGDERSL